jgi:hypothetical protein
VFLQKFIQPAGAACVNQVMLPDELIATAEKGLLFKAFSTRCRFQA